MKTLPYPRSQQLKTDAHLPLKLGLSERAFASVVEEMGNRLVYLSDRPEIEGRILSFLAHAMGPTTAGVARAMGIGVKAAESHLRTLIAANRIWGQAVHGHDVEWHIALEGRHYLNEHRHAA